MNLIDDEKNEEKYGDISVEDEIFIKRYLDYKGGKVRIGGWLIPQFILLGFNFLLILFLLLMTLRNPWHGFIKGLLILFELAMLGFIFTIFDFSKKRKKNTITLFKIYYGISIISGLITIISGSDKGYIGMFLTLIFFIYFFVSKRVKYTYTE
jgi:hypothetical protein